MKKVRVDRMKKSKWIKLITSFTSIPTVHFSLIPLFKSQNAAQNIDPPLFKHFIASSNGITRINTPPKFIIMAEMSIV